MDTTASRRQLHISLTKNFGRDSAVGRALNLLYGADVTGRDVGNRFSALNMKTKQASAGRVFVCSGKYITASGTFSTITRGISKSRHCWTAQQGPMS